MTYLFRKTLFPAAARRNPTRSSGRRGFTLVEALIVIGIISVLLTLVLPLASRMRDAARNMRCASNTRSLMQAFLIFAAEHDNALPGNFVDYANPDVNKRAWLLNYGQPVSAAPQAGTIFRYLGENLDVFRCPTLDTELANGNWGAIYGTNGRFDYSALGVFTGARLSTVSPESRFTFADGSFADLATPIILEEDPRLGISSSLWAEGLFNVTDRMSTVHRRSGNYAAIDGSVRSFSMPEGSNAGQWTSIGAKGKRVSFGNGGFGITYGWWNRQ